LYQHGYAKDVDHNDIDTDSIDIQVLEFLVKNNWFKPTIKFIIDQYHSYDREKKLVYPQKLIEVLVNGLPKPISFEDSKQIFDYGYTKRFLPYLFETILPHLDSKFKDENYSKPLSDDEDEYDEDELDEENDGEEDEEGDDDEDDQEEEENSNESYNEDGEDSDDQDSTGEYDEESDSENGDETETYQQVIERLIKKEKIEREMNWIDETDIWASWKTDSEFIELYNANKNNIVVKNGRVLDLVKDKRDITNIIKNTIERVGAIKAVQILYQKGVSILYYFTEGFYNQILLKSTNNKEYRDMVVEIFKEAKMNGSALLRICIENNDMPNFSSYFPMFKKYIANKIYKLFKTAVYFGNFKVVRIMESHKVFLSQYGMECLDIFRDYSFRYLLKDVDRIIKSTNINTENFLLLIYAITHGDNIGVKYLFTKHKFRIPLDKSEYSSEFIFQFSKCDNLAIIDYINNNRSTCFTSNTTVQAINLFFQTIFISSFKHHNVPLINYFIKNVKSFPLIEKQIKSDLPKYKKELIDVPFQAIVEFIDEGYYDSNFDPLMNKIINDRIMGPQIIEYIQRNHKPIKLPLQLIFDKIIKHHCKNTNFYLIYKDFLLALIQRYDCKLNQTHYDQYLSKYSDGKEVYKFICNNNLKNNKNNKRNNYHEGDKGGIQQTKKKLKH